jgi:excisionase family DNA binding protein
MPRKPRTPRAPAQGDLLNRDGFITPEELADYLQVPVATTDYWASNGGGPGFHKVGKYRRYFPADVKEWLKTRRKADTGTAA